MNKLLLLLSLIATTNVAHAQFKKGTKVINLGIAANPDYFDNGGAVTGAFEYGFANWFSAGLNADVMVGSFTQGNFMYSFIGFCPGIRASFHLSQINVENLDLYFGGSVGSRNFFLGSDPVVMPSAYKNGTYVIGYFGVRYRIVKVLGVFTEVSAGENNTSFLRLGLSFIIRKR